MTVCSRHPYSIVSSIGCPLCEGQRLAELDRKAGRRTQLKVPKRLEPQRVVTVAEVVRDSPDLPVASVGDRIWLRKAHF